MKTWADFGIDIPHGATGHIRSTCPECSQHRKKKTNKCLSINVGEGLFFCHHCGWTGCLGGGQTKEEIKIHFTRPEYRWTELPEKVVEWFKSRGIPERILAENKIGYGKSWSDRSGIQFPYFKNGTVVNIKHRSGDKRFRQEKDAEKILYRFDAIQEGDFSSPLIITEGEMDALSFQTAGHEQTCSVPDGAPSENTKQFQTKFDFLKSAEEIFAKYDRIVLAVDNDGPGKRLEEELARRIGPERCYRVEYPEGCKDANEVLVHHGKAALHNLVNDARPYPVEGLFTVLDYEQDVLNLYDQGINRGLLSGWKTLDELYSVRPHEWTVVTGIPGSGKSNFLDALCVKLAQLHDFKTLFFSPENWPIQRHIQSLIQKTESRPFARDGYITERISRGTVKESMRLINKYFFFEKPETGLFTVDEVLAKAAVAVFRFGINGLVIDPWNELDHVYQGMTEAQYLSKSLTKIRQFARKRGIHIWVVAHPRNLVKDENGQYKPPTMYEISGGAHWRNKADNGLCVHRPDNTAHTQVFVQKIRFNEVGKKGTSDLYYVSDTTEYTVNANHIIERQV